LICLIGYNSPKNTPFLFRKDEENGRKMVSLMFSTFAEDVGCLKGGEGSIVLYKITKMPLLMPLVSFSSIYPI